MHQIKMVVFDMAGTTVDEGNMVYKTLQKAISEAGYPVDLSAILEHGAGKEKLQAIKDTLSATQAEAIDFDQAEDIFNSFKSMLDQAYEIMDVKTFEGTTSLLHWLRDKGIKVVLNTGYNRQVATHLLSKLGWEQENEYDLLVTASDVSKGRPHPDMILHAMNTLNIDSSKTVIKVGDSAIDILEGKAAGCIYNIGVTTGAQTKEQLAVADPDYIADSLSIVRDLVQGIKTI